MNESTLRQFDEIRKIGIYYNSDDDFEEVINSQSGVIDEQKMDDFLGDIE
ncbi:hypothetical protein [Candidatus Sulfuricurvum sp. RIFRC-1]|nr:hypothetical protein [Candidatus Sulfuricurvum sp. RIFRC-1]